MMKRVIRQRKAGERFKVDGVTYEVEAVENEMRPCADCAFVSGDECVARIELVGICFKGMRADDVQVRFKRVDAMCVVEEDEPRPDSILDGDFSSETTEDYEE